MPVHHRLSILVELVDIVLIEAGQPLLASGLWTPKGEAATALHEGGEPVLPRHALPRPGCREWAAEMHGIVKS